MRTVPGVLAMFLIAACASTSGVADANLLAIRGVTIGTPRPAVIAALGTPMQVETGRDDIMGMGSWERLLYDGLMVEVIRPDSGVPRHAAPYVAIMEISGVGWVTAAGLRVGSSRAEVIRLLGQPGRTEDEAFFYSTKVFDGHIRVEFRNGVVWRIEVDEDWT